MRPVLQTNPSAFFPLSPQTRVLSSPGEVALLNAICYANERELPALIDRAMTMGASLNRPDCYECNALVIAVRANRPGAISSLMARGAHVPSAPADGLDLLMEACSAGHAEMAAALIEVARMSVAAIDANGKTALHHALISDTSEIVVRLLEAGADPDALIFRLDGLEILHIFGHAIPLSGKAVTPLMIAVARGNSEAITALLDAGANPNSGAHAPLLIAAFNRDQACFDALLSKGAMLMQCRDVSGLAGLNACIKARMPIPFLRKLVSQHDFKLDDGTIHSPLGSAIADNATASIALLMACNAPVEDHDRVVDTITIWDKALEPGKFHSESAKLLAARHPATIITTLPDAEELFGLLLANIDKPARLASLGFFTSLLAPAQLSLQAIAQAGTSSRQSAFAAAWTLRDKLPRLSLLQPHGDEVPLPPDEFWFAHTERELQAQRDALFDASTSLIDHCLQQIKDATTLNFFLECDADCPQQVSMKNFIAMRVIERSGAPDAIVKLIRDAWIMAAKSTIDWQVAPDSPQDSDRFLLVLARNLLQKRMDQIGTSADPLITYCRISLGTMIPLTSQPLYQFCSDPVAWLRKFENRNTLQDPVDSLEQQVQVELGLPTATCTAIVAVWRQALRAARTSRWTTLAQLNAVLGAYVARNISEALFDADSNEIISIVASAKLQSWVSRFDGPTTSNSRKRTAEGEAPGAPARKEART